MRYRNKLVNIRVVEKNHFQNSLTFSIIVETVKLKTGYFYPISNLLNT